MLLAACLISAKAKTFTYPDLNFQCTTPDGWNCDHKIGDVVHAFNNARNKCFCLRVYKYNLTRAHFQRAEWTMMARFQNQGYTASRRKPLILRGVSFDTFVFEEQTSTQTFRLDVCIGAFQGFIYEFELSMYDGIPSSDAELKSIVDSFDFLNRNGLSSPNSQSPSNSSAPSPVKSGEVD
jgi:hypothetical protein